MKGRLGSLFYTALPLLLFLFPYGILIFYFGFNFGINGPEFLWASKNSVIQAGVAAFLCIFLGFFLALGLNSFSNKTRALVKKLLIIPQILPPLFSVLIGFYIFEPIPPGHILVILIFFLINLGISVFHLHNAIESKAGSTALTCEIFGVSRTAYLSRVLIPMLKPELLTNFMLVFLFCLGSLAIPLVAGGGKGTNLEVLIFEKIYIEQAWDSAIMLLIFQTAIVFSIAYLFLRGAAAKRKTYAAHRFLNSHIAAICVLGYLGIYLGGYVYKLVLSLVDSDDFGSHFADLIAMLVPTLTIGFITILLWNGVLIVWILDYIRRLKHNFAIHFISISSVLVGFAFYLVFPHTPNADMIKLPLAFTVIFAPVLYKLFFERFLNDMTAQIVAAKVHSVSTFQIAQQIVFPQVTRAIASSTSLLLIFVLGDYAISRASGTQLKTLGIYSENLLTSYRLESAFVSSCFILFIWGLLSIIIFKSIKGLYGRN